MGNSPAKQVRGDPHATGNPASRLQDGSSAHGSYHHHHSARTATTVATPDVRRMTRREREAYRLRRELDERDSERAVSVQSEHVDGGYLVTLGTYSLSEDFSKPFVRQMIIERKLAPFWRGLNDHSDTWTENQLIAAARGLPIPPADEIPTEDLATRTHVATDQSRLRSLSTNMASSSFSSSPGIGGPSQRDRSKTTAGSSSILGSGSLYQEVSLPEDVNVNGQRLEVFLYKEVEECPICFLCYPPYLNKTRCCDQPICTECFVQIRRADPHPPEHLDEAAANSNEPQLITEPTCCPFCQTQLFGVSYEAPPFRRGLAYAHLLHTMPSATARIAQKQKDNLSQTRKRAESLSVNDPQVITSDHIRPDWERKLNEARAKASHRAATATAIHAAAMLMNETSNRGHVISFRRSRNDPSERRQPRTMEDLMLEVAIKMSLRESQPNGNPDGGSTNDNGAVTTGTVTEASNAADDSAHTGSDGAATAATKPTEPALGPSAPQG